MAEALTARDPRQLGVWKITSRLGFGGMGVVYLGTDGHQQAAVKVIRPGLLDDHRMADRFVREVSVLQAVRDVHISQFLDASLTSEPAWLAVEYIPGPTVKQQVDQDGPLPPRRWWALAQGIAQALAVLEVHRVTHRDIKPSNVILSGPGGSRAVLIDFGIAHPEDATSLTATGLVTGSPSWLSPEQANMQETGGPSDVFSLGSLLAYAGTGRPPFGEGVAVAVLMRIATSEPNLEGLDPAQRELVSAMLVKDPAARPSAREVLARARAGAREVAGVPEDRTMPGFDPTAVQHPEPVQRPEPVQPWVGEDHTAPDIRAAASAGSPIAAAEFPQAEDRLAQPASAGMLTQNIPQPIPEQGAESDGQPVPAQPVAGPAVLAPAVPQEPAPVVTPEMLNPSVRNAGVVHPVVVNPAVVSPPVGHSMPTQNLPAGIYQAPAQTGSPVHATPVPPAPTRGGGRKLPLLLILVAAVVIGAVIWFARGSGNPDPSASGTAAPDTASPSQSDTGSPTPTITGSPPPAPSSNQLRSGDWLLSQYRFGNDASSMWLDGTIQNRGKTAASAQLVVWIYIGGTPVGSVSTTVADVPAGGSKSVRMTGDAKWAPGAKTIILQAQ